MNKQPLFTLGIASYNYADYMKKLLDSIKNQSFKDYEILVSDDCSTDNSVEMVHQFAKENPQIKIRLITSEKNEGLVANKNKLIKNCHGLYLMLCDADDWMSDDCLEKLAHVIKKEHPDRVISQVAHINQENQILQIEYIPENQTKWGWNLHHGSVYKTDILKQHNITIKEMPDDVYFTIDFAKYCSRMSHVNETLYFWLVHTDSEGRKNNKLNEEYIRKTFGNVLQFVTDTMNQNNIHGNNDFQELKLVRLKLYYFYILFVFQGEKYRNKIKYYNMLHKKIIELDRNYLSCKYLSSKEAPILRKYPMQAIKLCSLLEKIHMMKLALLGYHIITKFKYFDQ